MLSTELVTVFNFREYPPGQVDPVLSPFKATREAIATSPRRKILEGTGEAVPRTALDLEGRFRRRATGWGELSN